MKWTICLFSVTTMGFSAAHQPILNSCHTLTQDMETRDSQCHLEWKKQIIFTHFKQWAEREIVTNSKMCYNWLATEITKYSCKIYTHTHKHTHTQVYYRPQKLEKWGRNLLIEINETCISHGLGAVNPKCLLFCLSPLGAFGALTSVTVALGGLGLQWPASF